MVKKQQQVKKKVNRTVTEAVAHIKATFNNTIVTFTDLNGNKLAASSGGAMGYKGSKKSTPYAAQKAVEQAAERAKEYGVKTLRVVVKGPGAGREAAMRALSALDFKITSMFEGGGYQFNGCRRRKKRRV